MTNVVSALTARTQLGQIIRRATRKNERFVVGRRGEPSVVIMRMKDNMETFAPAPKELKAMQATARRTGASKLTPAQINRIVSAARHEATSAKSPIGTAKQSGSARKDPKSSPARRAAPRATR